MKNANFREEGSPAGRHFVLIGGFLGAGKSTLIRKFAAWLQERGTSIGIVTNDQGRGLLDTATARESVAGTGSVAEITGGCFCCRLGDLVSAIARLDEEARPDAIIAEPVGSCTDLAATVVRPLEEIYKIPFVLTPLVVVLDPHRALAALGGRPIRRSFHRDVGYVFLKQIEEAEWLVVNKTDAMPDAELADLTARLTERFPAKRLSFISARTGDGVAEFFTDLLEARSLPSKALEIDYERYGVGEAMLGWVNSEADLAPADGGQPDWGAWLERLGEEVSRLLAEHEAEIGHFKMSITDERRRWRYHRVSTDHEGEIIVDGARNDDIGGPRLLLNLRAQGDGKDLEMLIDRAVAAQDEVRVEFTDRAAFQPGKPQPTHRIASLV